MDILVYESDKDAVERLEAVSELPSLLAREDTVIWVDLDIRDSDDLAAAEEMYRDVFKFHHLTIEDCREARNQPKLEEFPDYLFFIVHGVKPQTSTTNFLTKELDGFLGRNFVVTNRNESFRSVDAVKNHLFMNPRAMRKGAAFLLHQILDRMVDLYMPIVDDFDTAINNLEDRVYETKRGGNEILEEIMDLRRSVARLKRISTRQLEVLYRVSHGELPQIPEDVIPFFRDVHDHLLRIADLAENYRDLVSGLFEIHFSVTANRTNDVMKFLALISSTMLPLTLITGIYGMNFLNMPLLGYRYGFHVMIGMMFLVFLGSIIYFQRKGWFA
ncbi:MAG: magnesium/cobalt transporter CorA [Pyrinomonadaceae bacterium]